MVASIWLQLDSRGARTVGTVIADAAARNGTMTFVPHLTVCSIAEPTPERIKAATDIISSSDAIPLTVKKSRISFSTQNPFQAVVIEVENSPELRRFRESLRDATGAGELANPHISLLYTIDATERRTEWSTSEERLSAIARACEQLLPDTQYVLERPILVAPDGDWTNIKSWRTVHQF